MRREGWFQLSDAAGVSELAAAKTADVLQRGKSFFSKHLLL